MSQTSEKGKTNGKVVYISNPYKPWLVVLLLILCDYVSLSLAYYFAYQLTNFIYGIEKYLLITSEVSFQVYLILFLNILLVMNYSNGYQGFGRSNFTDFRTIPISITISYLFGLFLILVLKMVVPSLYFLLFFSWLFSIISFLVFRLLLLNFGSQQTWWRIPVIVVGNQKQVRKVIRKINSPNRLAFNPVALFLLDDLGEKTRILNIPCVSMTDEQITEFRSKHIRMAIITESDDQFSNVNGDMLNKLVYVFPHLVYEIQSPFFEIASIKAVDFFDKSAVQISYNLLRAQSIFVKRVIDILLSLISLVIVVPVYLIIGLAIMVDSKGKILFVQDRIGLQGKPFKLYKFRTMIEGADEKLAEILTSDTTMNHEFKRYRKLQDDPRITKVGSFLRKYSLDELPQIINIFRGEMSWVGPRAYLPEEIQLMRSKAEVIQSVKPGLTGWWQVNGRNTLTFKERMIMDEQYISQYTLWMDAYILVKTIKVILQGDGV